MITLKLVKRRDAIAVVLPQKILTRLNVKLGDELMVVESPTGYILIPHDSEIEEQLKLGLEFMREYRETLRTLAQ